jgi:hypothetical protein
MPVTYEPITTTTLTSSTTSFTLSNIPSTYTDLVLVIDGSPITGGSAMDSNWYVNGDTGNNYSDTRLQGNYSDRNANYSSSRCGQPWSTNRWYTYLHFFDYANTNINKVTLARSGNYDGSLELYGGLWRSTAAITSITLISGQARNYTSGTVATLYGIKAA